MSAVNGGNFLEWKRDARSFLSIAALRPTNDTLILGSESISVHGLRASASLFPMLGIQPRIGRSFTPEVDEMGHGTEIILTDALWRARFGANPEIVGKKISVNGFFYTVDGVLPPSFYFPRQDQIYNGAIGKWTSRVEYFVNLNLGAWERHAGLRNFKQFRGHRQGAAGRNARACAGGTGGH